MSGHLAGFSALTHKETGKTKTAHFAVSVSFSYHRFESRGILTRRVKPLSRELTYRERK